MPFSSLELRPVFAMKTLIALLLCCLLSVSAVFADDAAQSGDAGAIFTFWPLFDYRESPKERYSNLSILGPVFKLQQRGEERDLAIRPFFFRTTNRRNETASAEYLYPLASTDTTPEVDTVQVLKLLQNNTYRRNEGDKREKSSMFFPFYISGSSEKYGPYTSVFPFYGDIYERFWRDEYHFVMFPLYGRTVKKGTTTRNYLYPFFSTIEGEQESGFQFWPLYGQSAKEGVYARRFALWPFYMKERYGLDTDKPTEKLTILPLYAATDSPKKVSRSYLWPFFGYTDDIARSQKEVDYFWPFWLTVRGESRNATSWLPFYSEDKGAETLKRWYLWPIYKHEEINSPVFHQEKDRILYFLYSDNREKWPQDGSEKRRTALWPLFVYKRDSRGVSSLAMPAPVEPVFDREGIERNWAPFWRLYQQKWNDGGDSAVSFLWNLYWHELRGEALAYELFPLVAYTSEQKNGDLKLLKGLIRYRNSNGEKSLSGLWLPFGVHWGKAGAGVAAEQADNPRSVQ
jgi:hypothetical protein